MEKIYDNCCLCGAITAEERCKNVMFRENYVEGVGQLCDGCANPIKKSVEKAAAVKKK